MSILLTTPVSKSYERVRIVSLIFNDVGKYITIVYYTSKKLNGTWEDMEPAKEVTATETEYNAFMSQNANGTKTMKQNLFGRAEQYLIDKGYVDGAAEQKEKI